MRSGRYIAPWVVLAFCGCPGDEPPGQIRPAVEAHSIPDQPTTVQTDRGPVSDARKATGQPPPGVDEAERGSENRATLSESLQRPVGSEPRIGANAFDAISVPFPKREQSEQEGP
jgi:hypothetical protein